MKRLTIIGNIGRDPELRVDKQGKQFVTFSVAISVGTKDKPKTDWVEVSCNGKLAEIVATYAKKGQKVLVEGYPNAGHYTKGSNEVAVVERLYANLFKMLSRNETESKVSAGSENFDLPASDQVIPEHYPDEIEQEIHPENTPF
jgi:single-strand DNA-binding protein